NVTAVMMASKKKSLLSVVRWVGIGLTISLKPLARPCRPCDFRDANPERCCLQRFFRIRQFSGYVKLVIRTKIVIAQ
ncbi:MAG: hypothetical protein LCH90_16125, partial [Proteobacteria bacterium]|nr:hypothetical protein [Pseudomonadota bacterium]